jgi:hypothetical protein
MLEVGRTGRGQIAPDRPIDTAPTITQRPTLGELAARNGRSPTGTLIGRRGRRAFAAKPLALIEAGYRSVMGLLPRSRPNPAA